jgi:hypothetical protein
MYTWIKFIVFAAAALGSVVGFGYYLIAKPTKTTEVKTWKLLLTTFVLFAFIADRYYTILFE